MGFAALCGHHIGRHIGGDRSITGDHRIGSDAAKLMYASAAANKSLFSDLNMSRDHRVVCQHHAFTEFTIVSNVCIGHDKAVLSDYCLSTRCTGTVDRHRFAKDRTVSDDDMAHNRRIKADGLRIAADNRKGIDLDLIAEDAALTYDRIGANTTIPPHPDALFDQSTGANSGRVTDMRRSCDYSRIMNFHSFYKLTTGLESQLCERSFPEALFEISAGSLFLDSS